MEFPEGPNTPADLGGFDLLPPGEYLAQAIEGRIAPPKSGSGSSREDFERPPDRCRRPLYLCHGQLKRRRRNIGLHEQAEAHRARHQLMQEPKPLDPKPDPRVHGVDAGDVAARSAEARDNAGFDRVDASQEDDGDRSGRSLGGKCRPKRRNDGNPTTDQIGRQFRQPRVFIVRPSVFNGDIAMFDEAQFT
jgi:hypothetical protein